MPRKIDPPWKCACGALNEPWRQHCEACATSRDGALVAAQTAAASSGPILCEWDACDCESALTPEGVCVASGGYPNRTGLLVWANEERKARVPRFACPICRGSLDWAGGCERCHGCTTGRREDWTFPGPRYELEKGHWQKVAEGGRKACTPAENAKHMAELWAILGTDVARPGGTRGGQPSRVGIPAISDAVRAEVARRSGGA